ncbi:DUF502 domain-containing protein [Brevibacillus humidisoli]|uniref:DUF502 domain-containing protein n=1 Tax=Brevibacillus humidisoli TaxID=2895522 RepID=UPI001E2C4256|nr:DUF502 domain-containing protein [Brevibacillus humidisoli]UFJ42993.1 DUF502 domain-containing protein [Brevibacillus humidisoli]
MRRLARYFLEGLLYSVPLAVTIFVLYQVFITVDSWLGFTVPGLGFAVTIVVITAIGFLASGALTKSALTLVERLFTRVPLVKLLYNSLKDLIGAFVGEKKSFDQPVLVRLSADSQVKVIGFITRDSLETFGLRDHVAVYLPQSYNFAGNLLIVPCEQVEQLEADSADVMAFLVSGGVSGK